MPKVLPATAFLVAACLCAISAPALLARQAATLTLSVKNSPVYASPTPAPVQSALFMVTPAWRGTDFKTIAGGREVPGQTLFVGELAVVLSSRPADCDTVFALGPPEADKDFLIVAGKSEAYLPRREWKSTAVGKVFGLTPEETKTRLALEGFSVTIHGGGLKKKVVNKDGLGGSSQQLVLSQADGKWTVNISFKADDVVANGTLPVTACPTVERSKNELPPLLGANRLQDAARSY
jgi:hypothetical protein